MVAKRLVLVRCKTFDAGKLGALCTNSFVKYVGFGFVAPNQAAGSVNVDNSTLQICFMARKGRGPDAIYANKLRVIDGAASHHLSGEKDIWVGKRRRLKTPQRIFGIDSGAPVMANEIGTIEIPTVVKGKPTTLRVKNVLYMPQIGDVTLVSQGCLDDLKFRFTVADGVTSCYDKRGVMKWQAHKQNGLYQIQGIVDRCLLSKDEAHKKFGHINDRQLSTLGDFDGERSS